MSTVTEMRSNPVVSPQERPAARKGLLRREKELTRRRDDPSRLRTDLQKICVAISLIFLSLGFFFLGLLSFLNKPHADLTNVASFPSVSWIAGSSASLLAGTTFLIASCVFWRRYPKRRP